MEVPGWQWFFRQFISGFFICLCRDSFSERVGRRIKFLNRAFYLTYRGNVFSAENFGFTGIRGTHWNCRHGSITIWRQFGRKGRGCFLWHLCGTGYHYVRHQLKFNQTPVTRHSGFNHG